MTTAVEHGLEDQDAMAFYTDALQTLASAGVPVLVGGAYAFYRYAEIARLTKDFDVFVRPADVPRCLSVLREKGYRTEIVFPHWLSKAWSGEAFMDIIHNSGNGVVPVDDDWFAYAAEAEVLGLRVQLAPVEEMIWSKAFVMERERCDAADVAHLIRHCSAIIDWRRLVERFGERWHVLLAHLVLFGFIYPGERARVPHAVVAELAARLVNDSPDEGDDRVCNGTLLSRSQYLVDVERWGYEDGRQFPRGSMLPDDIVRWTAAIDRDRH